MTPDLIGRLQTRLLIFLVALLPLTAALAAATDLGGQPGAAALFVLYWLPVGLAAEVLYAMAQRLRREGDWPPAHIAYGLTLEGLAVFTAMRADLLPGLPACLRMTRDLALRRDVCAVPTLDDGATVVLILIAVVTTLAMVAVVLPVLLPRWPLGGWRLVRRRARS